MAEKPVWEVYYDPNYMMDYQDTHYVIESMLKPLQDDLEELNNRIKPGGEITPVTDYSGLTNKPTINSVEITGNLTLADIGVVLASFGDIDAIFES